MSATSSDDGSQAQALAAETFRPHLGRGNPDQKKGGEGEWAGSDPPLLQGSFAISFRDTRRASVPITSSCETLTKLKLSPVGLR